MDKLSNITVPAEFGDDCALLLTDSDKRWRLFGILNELLGTPTASGGEQEMLSKVQEIVTRLSNGTVECRVSGGNLLLLRRGTSADIVVLQQHCDVVRLGSGGNPVASRARVAWDGENVVLRSDQPGETLGADPLAGLAQLLDLITDPALQEVTTLGVVSVEEETGGFKIRNIDPEDVASMLRTLNRKIGDVYFFSLDGEGRDEITRSSGTVAVSRISIPCGEPEAIRPGAVPVAIRITGLQSEHSANIHADPSENVGSANVVLLELLDMIRTIDPGVQLVHTSGGDVANAFAGRAMCSIAVAKDKLPQIQEAIRTYLEQIRNGTLEYGRDDERLWSGAAPGKLQASKAKIELLQLQNQTLNALPSTARDALIAMRKLDTGVIASEDDDRDSAKQAVTATMNIGKIRITDGAVELVCMTRAFNNGDVSTLLGRQSTLATANGGSWVQVGETTEGFDQTTEAPAYRRLHAALSSINPDAKIQPTRTLGGLEVGAGVAVLERALAEISPRSKVHAAVVSLDIRRAHTPEEEIDLEHFFETRAAMQILLADFKK